MRSKAHRRQMNCKKYDNINSIVTMTDSTASTTDSTDTTTNITATPLINYGHNDQRLKALDSANCSSQRSTNCLSNCSCPEERVVPHEWPLCGEEVMGLETLHEESPTAKLIKHDDHGKTLPMVSRGQSVSREAGCTRSTCCLAPCPSKCTGGPGCYKSRPIHLRKQAGHQPNGYYSSAKVGATIVAQCAGRLLPDSDSLVKGQARTQRCSCEGSGANSSARVIAATHAGRLRQRRVGWNPSATGPETDFACDGYKGGRETRCHQSTELSLPTPRGHCFRDKAATIALPFPGQFRGETNVS